MYTAVALLAGLFVAIAIIVLQDMLDTTVKSGDDAEELLGILSSAACPSRRRRGNMAKKNRKRPSQFQIRF